MPGLSALIVDRERDFAHKLREWLSAHGLEVAEWEEWSEARGAAAEPAPGIVFIGLDPSDRGGLASCERAIALWPGARIVLASGVGAPDDLHGAHACLDKRALTPQELHVALAALVGPLLDSSDAADDKAEDGPGAGVAELEEEVRRLRWELDETRRAAESAPYSRDFLRLSGVVSTKEKEIVRLKKEIFARDHKIATGHRTMREALARALVATREKEAAAGHATQLQRDVDTEQAEVRRLRLEVQRQAAEAEQALASLIDERQQHDETRRQHEVAVAANAEALKQAKEEQARSRAALEAGLREERDQALVALRTEWKVRLKRLRRGRDRALSALNERLAELQAAHEEQMTTGRAEAERRRQDELVVARDAAERQREELRRLHELTLAEALAAQADAERRAEQHRSDMSAGEARHQQEKARAVDAAAAEWQLKLEDLRRVHADSVERLRRHFVDQLADARGSLEQERTRRDEENETALRRSAQELLDARTQAAQLDAETRRRYEEELARERSRHQEALAAVEARLREEREQVLAASAAAWKSTLDQLRADHAGSVDSMRRGHQDQLRTLQASAAEELARREGEHDAVLRGVQGAHLEALTGLEARLREEKEQAVAAAVAAWYDKLEELRRQNYEALDTLRREHREQIASLHASHEQAAAERDAANQASLARAEEERAALRAQAEQQRAELLRQKELALEEARAAQAETERRADEDQRSARRASEERLRGDQARALSALSGDWEGRLDETRRGHAASLEAMRQRFQDQLAELRASAARELGARDGEHQAALRAAAADLAQARTEAARLDQETRQRYEQELVREEARHLEALVVLEARLREDRDRAVAEVTTGWEARLEDLRLAHAASVDGLRHEHQDQIAAIRAAREHEIRQAEDEHEAALRRLGEELAVSRSKAGQPGPVQLQARHAEALRALEARLLEEKEQAVTAAVADWKAKMERLRRGHADAMAALRREHEDQLLALDAARQDGAGRQPSDPGTRVVPLKAVNRDRSS